MSKTFNGDVEDVLFSIRRLVTETAEDISGTKDEPEGENTDALFLTSALRVNDPATEPEQVDLEDMTTGLSHFRNAVSGKAHVEEPMTSIHDAFLEKTENSSRRLHLSEIEEETVVAETPSHHWTTDPDTAKLSEFATEEDLLGQALPDPVDAEEEIVATSEEMPTAETAEEMPQVENAAAGLADPDNSTIDESVLRDMVTEIVREELSGELGERITRNVRKLVRREIHRALLAREID